MESSIIVYEFKSFFTVRMLSELSFISYVYLCLYETTNRCMDNQRRRMNVKSARQMQFKGKKYMYTHVYLLSRRHLSKSIVLSLFPCCSFYFAEMTFLNSLIPPVS